MKPRHHPPKRPAQRDVRGWLGFYRQPSGIVAGSAWDNLEMREWVETRPPNIRAIAAEFPLGFSIFATDGDYVVIGWNNNNLILAEAGTIEALAGQPIPETVKRYMPLPIARAAKAVVIHDISNTVT